MPQNYIAETLKYAVVIEDIFIEGGKIDEYGFLAEPV